MLTWGSHGDIRPFLALADGLQAAGHDVHLVITPVEDVAPDGFQSVQGARITVLNSLRLSPEQAREDAMFAAAQRLCADADLLIGHYFMHPLQIAAEHAGLPYVSVLLSHGAVPSAFSHPLGIPMAGKFGNRLLWWLTRTMIHRTLEHYPNRLRRQVGLAPTQDMVKDVWLSSQLSLLAVSRKSARANPIGRHRSRSAVSSTCQTTNRKVK